MKTNNTYFFVDKLVFAGIDEGSQDVVDEGGDAGDDAFIHFLVLACF